MLCDAEWWPLSQVVEKKASMCDTVSRAQVPQGCARLVILNGARVCELHKIWPRDKKKRGGDMSVLCDWQVGRCQCGSPKKSCLKMIEENMRKTGII